MPAKHARLIDASDDLLHLVIGKFSKLLVERLIFRLEGVQFVFMEIRSFNNSIISSTVGGGCEAVIKEAG